MAVTTKKKTAAKIKLQPLGARLVIQRDEQEEKSAGGIVLPGNSREKPNKGTVISVGNGRILKDGSRSKMQVKEGDRILFTSYGPDEVKLGEDEFLLLHEDDVLAVFE
jgi:chaperonin GroES